MTKPVVTLRNVKGSALDYTELDTNFTNLRDATVTINGDTGSIVNDLNGAMTVAGGTGLTSSVSGSTLTLNLDNTTVTAGSYTAADITIDAQGRITAAANGSGGTFDSHLTYTYQNLDGGTPEAALKSDVGILLVGEKAGTHNPTGGSTGTEGFSAVRIGTNIDIESDANISIIADGNIVLDSSNPSGNSNVILDNQKFPRLIGAINQALVTSSISGSSSTLAWKTILGPAFRAYVDTNQTITSGSQQKVTFGTETFDTNSNFASSRFTPTVEGYYQLNATVRMDNASGTDELMITIWKNGSEYARGWNNSGVAISSASKWWSMSVSDIAYANGSTDYFEIYIQQTSGSNRTTTIGSNISYFSGCMIRSA